MALDFTVFPLRDPRRALELYGHLDDLDFFTRRRHIPQLTPGELFPDAGGEIEVRLARVATRARTGDTQIPDIYTLCLAVAATGAKRILEIGTFNGMTALNLAINAPAGAKIYTLDLPASEGRATAPDASLDDHESVRLRTPGWLYRDYRLRDREIIQLYGDSIEFDFRPYYDSMDLVYIDGGHSYAAVKRDTDEAFKMVKKHGMVFWHDYKDRNGVGPVIDELAGRHDVVHIRGTWLAFSRRS